MAQIKTTFVCLVFVLIFCQEIQSIEGRRLELGNTTVTAANANVSPPKASSAPVEESAPARPKHADDFSPTMSGPSNGGIGHAIQN